MVKRKKGKRKRKGKKRKEERGKKIKQQNWRKALQKLQTGNLTTINKQENYTKNGKIK